MLLFTKSRTEKQLQQFIRASSAVQDEVVYLETFRDRLRNEHFSDTILKEMQALILEIYDKLSDIRLVLESIIEQNTGAKDYKNFKTWEETTHRMVLFNQLVSECNMFLEMHRITEAALMNKLETILFKEKQEEARVAQKIGLYQKAVRSTATVATGIALLLGAGTAMMPRTTYGMEAEANVPTGNMFRQLGWDVYDDVGLKSRPNKIAEYRMWKNQFVEALQDLRDSFSDKENASLFRLINNSDTDDELKSAYVSSDDFLLLSVVSQNQRIGKNGVYTIMKKVDASTANRLRSHSPDYK